MNRDLIIGILVSLALHSSIYLFSHGKQPPPPHIAKAKDDVIQFEMPPPEEEKDETVKDLDDTPIENQLAPPSLVDMPSVVPVDAFTQPLTPPPPPNMVAAKGTITIPVTKPGANFGKGIDNLFNVGDLDQKPVLRVSVNPTYPYEMSRAGITGEVMVEFIINTNGDVTQAQVVRSSHREFEAPAVQAVLKWKFKPGRKGGRTVNVRAAQPIEFNLDDSK
jgi:protein TonB